MEEEIRESFLQTDIRGKVERVRKSEDLKGILKNYSSFLGLDNILIFISETDTGELICYSADKDQLHRYTLEVSANKKLIRYGQGVDLEKYALQLLSLVEIDNSSSLFCLPIFHGKTKIGLIAVGSIIPRIFNETDRTLVEIMADHIVKSTAIENYQKQLSKSSDDLALLVEMSKLINSGENFEEVLANIIDKLSEIIDAETGGILLYEPERQQLVLQKPAFGVRSEEIINSYRVPLGTGGNAVAVFTSGQPYVSNDAPSDPRLLQKFIKIFKVRNTVSVPLQVEQRHIGVIHLINKKNGPFTQTDVNLLCILASQIAGLIEKARMFEEIKRQEQETKALYQIGLNISSMLDLDDILQSVVEKACLLLQCEMSAVALVDNSSKNSQLRAVHGPMAETFKNIRIRLDQGITDSVICFSKPARKVFHDYGSLGEESELELVLKSLGYKSVVAVPLGNAHHITGILFSWRKSDVDFSKREINLLSRLANQASIAIENARLYKHKEKTVSKLTEFNQIIEHQHLLLKKSLEIHNELTQIVLQNNGLNAIAKTLSKLIYSPVIVLDQFFKKIAYSVEEKSELEECFNQENFANLLNNAEVKSFLKDLTIQRKPKVMQPCAKHGLKQHNLFAPIVIDSEIMGYVVIVRNKNTVEELDIVAIEHATAIFALEMVKKKIAYEVEKKLKVDYLDDLLTGNFNSEMEIIDRANYLGYDLSKPNHQVIIIEFGQNTKEASETALNNKKFEIIDDFIKLRSPGSIVVAKGNITVILAELTSKYSKPVELANKLHKKLKEIYPSLRCNIGIGREVKTLQGFSKSFEEAKQSIKIIQKFSNQGKVVLFEELGIYTLLGQIESEEELRKYVNNLLGPLFDYDKRKGTDFLNTLESFLENSCNIQQTARNTYIHVNTLNYRLSRIQEILDIDLRYVDDRLKLQVAFKILELMEH